MGEWRGQYHDEEVVAEQVAAGQHREIVGGMWDELGAHQLDFLTTHGLQPNHNLLDLGCGSGRLAVKAAPYLTGGGYYGIDISAALIEAAQRELEAIGSPTATFHTTSDFCAAEDMPSFDFIIAQSLFTHLPLDKFGEALDAVSTSLKPAGHFFATFFIAPEGTERLFHARGGVTTFANADPFHFTPDLIQARAIAHGWSTTWIGEWDHPRDQQMVAFKTI